MNKNEQEVRSHRFAQLIGLELKASFARHETSQAEVAERLGHSKSGYSRWLNAKPSIPMEALLNTCELIGADPRQILDAAYDRLLSEMGEYPPDEVEETGGLEEMTRCLFNSELVAGQDENLDRERQGGEGR